jgi:hypothetical protein
MFSVENAQAQPFAAAPTIAFSLQVANPDSQQAIQSIALRCQILIEAARRHYVAQEREGLRDLFGEPDRWSQTVRSLLWTHVSANVPAFSGAIQFSGTVFYAASNGTLQIDQIGWDKEARFKLPARIWREMMDHYYPNSAWLRLRRDAFDRLHEYKRRHGMATWEEAIDSLLPLEKEAAS